VDADSVNAAAAAAAVVVSVGAAATSVWSDRRRRIFEEEQEDARQNFEAAMAAAQHEFDVDLEREKLAMGRRMDAEAALARYRDPLARAAEDLRSRLWNVRCGEFLQTYGVGSDAVAREARLSTLFRIAQYFAWSEILRREVQYLSFPDAEQTRSVMQAQEAITDAFRTDELDGPLMLWTERQRAIGERMIVEEDGVPRSMGYGRFVDRCDEVLGEWGPSLDADLRALAIAADSDASDTDAPDTDAPDTDAPDTDAPDDRLHELERRLTHLRNLLDPEGVLELYGTPPANPA